MRSRWDTDCPGWAWCRRGTKKSCLHSDVPHQTNPPPLLIHWTITGGAAAADMEPMKHGVSNNGLWAETGFSDYIKCTVYTHSRSDPTKLKGIVNEWRG